MTKFEIKYGKRKCIEFDNVCLKFSSQKISCWKCGKDHNYVIDP